MRTALAIFTLLTGLRLVFAADVQNELREIRDGQRVLERMQNTYAISFKQIHEVNCHRGSYTYKAYNFDSMFLIDLIDARLCCNKDYCFSIKKSTINSPYTLFNYNRVDKEKSLRQWLENYLIAMRPLTTFSEMQTVGEFLNDPNVMIESCQLLPGNKYQLAYSWSSNSPDNQRTAKGTAVFDRCHHCILIEAHKTLSFANGAAPLVVDAFRTFDTDGSNITLKDFKEYYTQNSKRIRVVENIVLHDSTPNLAPAEFSLEYYGITPPTDDVYEDRVFNWPLWGGVGVGCILLSLLLAWIIRRRNRLKAGG